MNPLLPPDMFIPDVEAREVDDRLYLYGSRDQGGDSEYCSDHYRVFSSADLESWTDQGVAFSAARAHGGPERRLYAPDCLRVGDRHLLAYCDSGKGEGIAVSSHPQGPFDHARPVVGANGDGIDPALFLDDDGTLYYFWGQFQLRAGILDPETLDLQPGSVRRGVLTEAKHGFHEGASIRKRNGIYYLVYADISRGRPTCLSYATASRPLGPYTKQGVLIDNADCDPASWNNHGSLACFGDQWLLFYHRSSRGTRTHRRVCAEPVAFRADGKIDEMAMTCQGLSPPLSATNWTDAWRACSLSGGLYAAPVDGEEVLTNLQTGDLAGFRYLRFLPGLRYLALDFTGGHPVPSLEVRLDDPDHGLLLCEGVPVVRAGVPTLPLLHSPEGVHALWIRIIRAEEPSPSLRRFQFTASGVH
jgi:hypothetical protein